MATTAITANMGNLSMPTSLQSPRAPLRLLAKSSIGPLASWITSAGGNQSGATVSLFTLSTNGNSVSSAELDCGGKLTITSQQSSGGAGPVHLSMDGNEEKLICANYGGGNIAVFPVSRTNKGATLGPVAASMEFGAQAHAHSAVFAPGSGSLFVPTLGLDAVQQLQFSAGTLSKNGEPLLVPPSQGPRHIAFHPKLPIAVLVNEGSADAECTIILCSFDASSGRLSQLATYDTLPSSYDVSSMYPAEVLFSPDGSFVLISNRDATNQKRDGISVFQVGPGQSLSFKQYASVGHYPRSMALTTDGVLIVGNQKGNSLSLLQLDSSGMLSRITDDVTIGQSPAFVGVFKLATSCGGEAGTTMV